MRQHQKGVTDYGNHDAAQIFNERIDFADGCRFGGGRLQQRIELEYDYNYNSGNRDRTGVCGGHGRADGERGFVCGAGAKCERSEREREQRAPDQRHADSGFRSV
jgi:hypothetical protein